MTIAVIDYGIGNVQSVVNACVRHGRTAHRVWDGAALEDLAPTHIILPGVGAVGAALERLRVRGFEHSLEKLVVSRATPFLGICVGMQMMADRCEEYGVHKGLGWIPGVVVRLSSDAGRLRVPHVGWNTVRKATAGDEVLGAADGQDFYFVHSYRFDCPDSFVAGRTTYGAEFASAVRRGAIHGVQFHPEKSAQAGFDLIGRFLEVAPC